MNRLIEKKESKTISEVKRLEIEMVEDKSANSERRTANARDIIAKMIFIAKKNGRPSLKEREFDNAA